MHSAAQVKVLCWMARRWDFSRDSCWSLMKVRRFLKDCSRFLEVGWLVSSVILEKIGKFMIY